MSVSTTHPVRKQITVRASQAKAFELFTEGIGRWWNPHHKIGAEPFATAVMEPREGGRWFERAADGSECDWGRVLAYDPPERLTLAWMIGPTWQFDPDPANATEVEVRFIAEGDTRTRVELEHRGLEKHGEAGAQLFATFSGEGGWGKLLELYAALTR